MWYKLLLAYLLAFEAVLAVFYVLGLLGAHPLVRRLRRFLWPPTPPKNKIHV